MDVLMAFTRVNSVPNARERRLVVLFPVNHLRLLVGIFGVHLLVLACEVGNAHFGIWHHVSDETEQRLRQDLYLDLIVRFWILALVYGGAYALLSSWCVHSWMLFQSLWSWVLVALLHGAFQLHMFVGEWDNLWDLLFPFVMDLWSGAFVLFAYRVLVAHEKTMASVVYEPETIELLSTPPVAQMMPTFAVTSNDKPIGYSKNYWVKFQGSAMIV